MKSRCLVALSLSTTAIAQSLAFTALTPAPFLATIGPQVQTATLPAGPMAPGGFVGAQVALSAVATLDWWSNTSDTFMSAGLSQRCAGFYVGTTATAGPIDVQLDLVAAQVTPVRIVLSKLIVVPPTGLGPLLRVDVGSDGTFELTESSYHVSVDVDTQLGPTALPVRVLMDMALFAVGDTVSTFYIQLFPRTGPTVTTALGGCTSSEYYWVQPTFAGNLNAYAESYSTVPPLMLAVLGLGVQPLVLGATATPCVLFPSPDLVMLVAPATLPTLPVPPIPAFTLPIPPGVGPLSLWTQAVVVAPGGLTTTTAFRVDVP